MKGQQLTLRDVKKSYGPVRAVGHVTLDIKAGEFVSLVGPSGSGKTTLLTMVAGFETPSAGSIHVGKDDVTMLAPNRRNIGMVFQKYALFPHMTVRQNIAFPLKMRRLASAAQARSRVEAMLELVRLDELGERYPHQLSGGQQQRVAVARALVFDPAIILMDEPLGALDKKLREAMQFEIKQLQERIGATVVYVTHDQEEALSMSDRVAVMHNGRLEQVGTPNELYGRPATPFIADFVGTINFLDARLCSASDTTLVVRIADHTLRITRSERQAWGPGAPGDHLKLAARPEHISMRPLSRQTTNDIAGLAGTVEAMVFAGATRTALVRLDALPQSVLRIGVPADGDFIPNRGDAITVSFQEDALHAFSVRAGDAP